MLLSPTCMEGATWIKVRGFSYLGYTLDLEYVCGDGVGDTHSQGGDIREGGGDSVDISMYATSITLTVTAEPQMITRGSVVPSASRTPEPVRLQLVDNATSVEYELKLEVPVTIAPELPVTAGSAPASYTLRPMTVATW